MSSFVPPVVGTTASSPTAPQNAGYQQHIVEDNHHVHSDAARYQHHVEEAEGGVNHQEGEGGDPHLLLDALSDIHAHDDLYHHFVELFHANNNAHTNPTSTTLSATVTTGGEDEHSPQQQQPALGATLRSLMDAQHGSSAKDYRLTQDKLLEHVHQVMDHTLEMASMQGKHGSERHGELEMLISKATLRMALATLAERHRDEVHLKGGGLEGKKSKFDGKPMWSFLHAPHLHLTEQAYRWYHHSYFRNTPTVRNLQSPSEFRRVVDTGVTQAYMVQALYDDHHGVDTLCTTLYQTSIVADGRSDHVRWIISEGSRYKSEFYDEQVEGGEDHHHQHDETSVLSLTIRGYIPNEPHGEGGEAGSQPRDQLLVDVAYAQPTPLNNQVMVHSGLYKVAQSMYRDVKPYLVDRKHPNSKIVISGHSVGGSVASLVLLLLAMDKGPEWTQENVLRVYTYGAIPVLRYTGVEYPRVDKDSVHSSEDSEFVCPVLASMGLPPSMVYTYVQPWDPIPRLFSEVDPFHHAFDDVGKDGVSLLASGPADFRRPMRHYWASKARRWPLWNSFRDNIRAYGHEHYRSVGIAHLLLPGQRRYLTDVFAHIDLYYSEIHSLVRVDGTELLSVLFEHFPMDSYSLLHTSVAMRSLWHHLMPSYALQFHYFQEWGATYFHKEGHVPKSSWLP